MRHNIFYNTLYQLVNLIIPIITAPYLARVLGVDGVGLSAYAKALAGYFLLFAMQGLNNYGNRTIALSTDSKETVSKCFWEIYLVQCFTSILASIIYILYVYNYAPNEYRVVLIINIVYVVSAIFDINWFYFGLGKFRLTATRNISIKIISTIFIFLFVKKKEDVNFYVAIISVASLVSNLVLWFYLERYVYFVKIRLRDCIKHIKPNCVLFIPALAISVYKLMDKVMLGILSGVEQNGYYENASNIVTIPLSIITAMGTVMLPKISEMVKQEETDKILIINRDSIQIMLGLSIPFSMGIICVADSFVPLYFGNEFKDCIIVLQLLAITCPFIAIGNVVRTQCVIPFEKDSIYVYATIIGAVLNFIVNYFAIPCLGAIGAAIGTIVAEASVVVYQCICMRQYLKKIPIIKDNLVFLLASIIMGILVTAIEILQINRMVLLIIQVVFGSICYCLLVFIYFYNFDERRISHWLGIIKKKKQMKE